MDDWDKGEDSREIHMKQRKIISHGSQQEM